MKRKTDEELKAIIKDGYKKLGKMFKHRTRPTADMRKIQQEVWGAKTELNKRKG